MRYEQNPMFRPLLADNLQLHISSDFLTVTPEIEKVYDESLKAYMCKGSPFKVKYFSGVPYCQIPNNLMGDYPYISNIRISLRKPYTVTIAFNFIRFLLNAIKDNPSFDKERFKAIQINEDNFINFEVWHNWDYGLIYDLSQQISDKACTIAHDAFNILIPLHELSYNVVSLKKAEFNIEYFDGCSSSLQTMKSLHNYINSDRGLAWIHDLKALAVKQRIPNDEMDRSIKMSPAGQLNEIRFDIGSGVSFKLYQKTTDHIRAEITFEGKKFIKKHFKKWAFDSVYEPLRIIAQDFFNQCDFKVVLTTIKHDVSSSPLNPNVLSPYQFLDAYDPVLSRIIDTACQNEPIDDAIAMNRIKSDPHLRPFFDFEFKKLKNGEVTGRCVSIFKSYRIPFYQYVQQHDVSCKKATIQRDISQRCVSCGSTFKTTRGFKQCPECLYKEQLRTVVTVDVNILKNSYPWI